MEFGPVTYFGVNSIQDAMAWAKEKSAVIVEKKRSNISVNKIAGRGDEIFHVCTDYT